GLHESPADVGARADCRTGLERDGVSAPGSEDPQSTRTNYQNAGNDAGRAAIDRTGHVVERVPTNKTNQGRTFMKRIGTVAWLLCMLLVTAAQAQPVRNGQDVIWARDVAGAEMTLDGVLDEAVWQQAETINLVWNG